MGYGKHPHPAVDERYQVKVSSHSNFSLHFSNKIISTTVVKISSEISSSVAQAGGNNNQLNLTLLRALVKRLLRYNHGEQSLG